MLKLETLESRCLLSATLTDTSTLFDDSDIFTTAGNNTLIITKLDGTPFVDGISFESINISQGNLAPGEKFVDLKIINTGSTTQVIDNITIQGAGFGIGNGAAQFIQFNPPSDDNRNGIIDPDEYKNSGYQLIPGGDPLILKVAFDPADTAGDYRIGDHQATLKINREVSYVIVGGTTVEQETFDQSITMQGEVNAPVSLLSSVKVSGPGSAQIFLNENQNNLQDISRVELTASTEKTTLEFKNKTEISVGNIEASGSLGAIKGAKVNLTDGIQIDGSLINLTLNNIAEGAQIEVSAASTKAMTIKANIIGVDANQNSIVDNVLFNLAGDVKTFQANEFNGDSASDAASLTARSLGTLTVKTGDLSANVQVSQGVKSVSVLNAIAADLKAGDSIGSVTAKTGAISGMVMAANDIKSVTASKGAISGDIISQNGSIGKLTARQDISGRVMAANDINSVSSSAGDITGWLRADNIKTIKAINLDGARLSAAASIGSVSVKTDVIDSLVLAGFDTGMSADKLNFADDALNDGSINSFKFGGAIDNSYVTAGAMTDNIYTQLYSSLPSGADYAASHGTIKSISGKGVVADNGGAKFGFYSAGTIKTKLNDAGDFQVQQNVL